MAAAKIGEDCDMSMKWIVWVGLLALAGCQTTMSSVQQTVASICQEGNAINAAAGSPAGLSAAASFGTGAGTVLSTVAKNNAKLQALCLGANLLLPAATAIGQQLMTSNAKVLATNAAPPALVAAARKQ